MTLWHFSDLRDERVRQDPSRKPGAPDGKWPLGLSLCAIVLSSLGLWAALIGGLLLLLR